MVVSAHLLAASSLVVPVDPMADPDRAACPVPGCPGSLYFLSSGADPDHDIHGCDGPDEHTVDGMGRLLR